MKSYFSTILGLVDAEDFGGRGCGGAAPAAEEGAIEGVEQDVA